MAGNLKNGGIKGLALAHCEKVVAGLAVLGAAYFVWQSSGIETLDRDPGQLTTLVGNTRGAYDEATWENSPEEDRPTAVPVPSPRISEGGEGIFADGLAQPNRGLSRPVLPPIVDREDPRLLPPIDLEGVATTAIFAFLDESVVQKRLLEERQKEQEKALARQRESEAGGDLTRVEDERSELRDEQGRKRRTVTARAREAGVPTQGDERFELLSSVCVLAKAPILEQYQLYRGALLDARGYEEARDIPQYYGLYAQRAEVRGDGELEWVDVRFGGLANQSESRRALSTRSHTKMIDDWIDWPQSIADQRYLHPVLTMPLAPLVKQNWDADTIHSEVPTEAEALAAQEREAEALEAEEELPEGADEFDEAFAGTGQGGRRGRFGGEGRGGFRRGGGGELGGAEVGGSGSRGSRRGNAGGGDYQIDPDIPFAMVRFWDFGVAPGRQYQYRVKLVLIDVNRDRDVRRYLSPEVRERVEGSRSRIVVTDWSEPGPIVSVPLAGDAFIAEFKRSGRGAYAEGKIDLLVQSYSLDDGRAIKAAVQKEFRRGSVLNFTEDAEFLAPDGRWIVEADDFEFQTGLTVADFRGGEELPGRMKTPARTLMMDANGKLFVRDELEDFREVLTHRETFEETKSTGRGRSTRGGGEFGGELGF